MWMLLAWLRGWRRRRRERWDLVIEHLALQHQVRVLQRSETRRPRLTPWDRLFWLILSHLWPRWRGSLLIVHPGTVAGGSGSSQPDDPHTADRDRTHHRRYPGFGRPLPILPLAQATSALTLAIFAVVNLALWRVKRRDPQPPGIFAVPAWVPVAGFLVSLGFPIAALLHFVAG